ncbi:LuxR C-terminal-related transcriptional regulator [Actinotalea sp. K2]|uniref:helix-turn-helix transcriptional regulator n=1 Tax=Actinotalea sp. K2 TaxID=2939438 RepID=UPI002017F820|nr:LuxR C-terminal-related transcriptional regulator [Actinotalea sp. K2]MCL3862270.1 LuxR C-terminal-related transcriptional regulator [Actinotalea sp. K2]
MAIDYRRWWELAVELRAGVAAADAVRAAALALVVDLDAWAIGLVGSRRTTVAYTLGVPCRPSLDVRFCLEQPDDVPLLVRLRQAGPGGPVCCESSAAPTAAWARCDEDGASGAVALPLPLPVPVRPADHPCRTWLAVVRAERFSTEELDLVAQVHRLLATHLDADPPARSTVRSASSGHVPSRSAVATRRSPVGSRPSLTTRELSVLALMAEGLVVVAIGRRLKVSPRTVAKHQENIYRKLAAGDRVTAVLRAQAEGLLERVS